MSDTAEIDQAGKRRNIRIRMLLFALITSPLICCGCVILLGALPASLNPIPLANLFEAEVRVENGSGETLYITPITTTYGEPRVIGQSNFIRQRDIPLQPSQSIVLTYDAADMPLSGIAVCRTNDDCRLLDAGYPDEYRLIGSFDSLPELEPDWLPAIQSHPKYSFNIILFPALSLLPFALFLRWLYLSRLERKRAAADKQRQGSG